MSPTTIIPTAPATSIPTASPTTRVPTACSALVRKVRVQLLGVEILNLREVKVFDQNGVNVALNKAATQSSTYIGYDANWDAANAVDGDTAIANAYSMSSTLRELGKYLSSLNKLMLISFNALTFLHCSHRRLVGSRSGRGRGRQESDSVQSV
jgi:hypothetical protein